MTDIKKGSADNGASWSVVWVVSVVGEGKQSLLSERQEP
jgi:hypothetical protein